MDLAVDLAAAMPSPRRAIRMVQRNAIVYRHGWMVILSGFFEPLFYLLSLGLGLGGYVPAVDGLPYAAFVAPGLLASSCLNGAITDGFFNIFFKLHFAKIYDGVLATPMRVVDIGLGELIWALARGSAYAATFLGVMGVLGWWQGEPILRSWWAVLALPAAILTAASLSAMALCLTTVVTRVEQFDTVMGVGVMPMFLFSGIFFPVSQLPVVVQGFLQLVPLYHAVELLRACTTGEFSWATAWHLVYLVTVGVGAFVVAMTRLERALIK